MKHLALFVALLAVVLTGCVSARNEDGTVSMRFSRFADEAEVLAVTKRVDGVETALATERTERTDADATIRADVKTADDAASLAFQTALAEGKTASEAMGAATAAAAAQARTLADEARAKAVKAEGDAAEARKARDEIDSGIIGKLGIEEILAIILGGGAAGTAGVRMLRGAPLKSGSGTAKTPVTKPGGVA